jgi:cell wall-active antibiotic response 4TMS protein YvqF
MGRERVDNPAARLAFGVLVMFVGLMLTLDNFGILDARRFWRLWPILLIALGLGRLSRWTQRGGRPEGLTLIIVGIAFLLANLHVLEFGQLFPLALFLVGALMVTKATRFGPGHPTSSGEPQIGRFDAFSMLGGVRRTVSGPGFRGGTAFAILGGCEIDLRQATIQDGSATVDAFALWGGIEIRVPEDWVVETRGIALLGAFEDKTRHPGTETKRLVLTGLSLMGGVEVKN